MLRQEWRRLDRHQTTVSAPFPASTAKPDCGTKRSPKAYLHQLCTAQHWKQPLFLCCNEEGPNHDKLFTFKVVVSNEEGQEILECLGNPRSNKKAAAEDAAEGALWCFKNMGIN